MSRLQLENGLTNVYEGGSRAFDSLVEKIRDFHFKKVPTDCEPSIQCKPQSIVKTR